MRTDIEQINVVRFINVLRFKLSEGILTSARVLRKFKETFHLRCGGDVHSFNKFEY